MDSNLKRVRKPKNTPRVPETQPLKTFIARDVPPQQPSGIQLSGGRTRPFYYSLATTSTVPFATMQGSGGLQKEFSWGETIAVAPGETVTVTNSSRHRGDIIIQSGHDEANKPERISFPVEAVITDAGTPPGTNAQVEVTGFIDTRRARRAFWTFQPFMPDSDVGVYVIGYYAQHTANPSVGLSALFPGASWYSFFVFPALTFMSRLPLGLGSSDLDLLSDLPMTLPDFVHVQVIYDTLAVPDFNFVTLEY